MEPYALYKTILARVRTFRTKEAYNSAYKEYAQGSARKGGRTREETAHAVAWSAVKKKYKKGQDGKWHPK